MLHIPPQDLQQLRHPIEVLRLINKTARTERDEETRRDKRQESRKKVRTLRLMRRAGGKRLPSVKVEEKRRSGGVVFSFLHVFNLEKNKCPFK